MTVGGTPIAAMEEDLSNATPGGTLRFGRAEDSDNLDPVTNDGNVNIWYFMSIYDQLVRVGADGISLVPGLAESWDVSEDGLTYTFHLRPNVMFSDGTPMTSADVLYSWVRAANDPGAALDLHPDRPEARCRWPGEGITTPDEDTVVVELAQPWAPFLSDVAMFNMSVISEAFAAGNEERLAQECMGTGPFALGEWRKGESLSLVKNAQLLGGGAAAARRGRRLRGAGRQRAHPAAPGRRDRRHEGRPLQPRAGAAAGPESEGLPVPVDRNPLHHPQHPQRAARRRPRPPRAAVRHRPPDAGRRGALRRRRPGDLVHAEGRALLERHPGAVSHTIRPRRRKSWRSRRRRTASRSSSRFSAGSADDETLATALKDMWSQIGVEVTITPTEGERRSTRTTTTRTSRQ